MQDFSENSATVPVADTAAHSLYSDLSIPHSVLSLIPFNLAVEYFILPVKLTEFGQLEALMAYPCDAEVLQTMQMYTGLFIRPREVSKEQLLSIETKITSHEKG